MRQEHRRAGLEPTASSVIHGGVEAEQFHVQRTAGDFSAGPLKLLYAGYVEPMRGLHTIIEAMGALPAGARANVRLSIAQTDPPNPNQYLRDIKSRIDHLGLSGAVAFIGRQAHDAMRAVYAGHHVLVSATTRVEGLPLTMTEALCAGCAVITTGSGGAIELAEAAGLPIFPKDDAGSLSTLIAQLESDRAAAFAIAERGQQVVLERFTLARMNERIAALLASVA
jgi:glycosyltransferase involved in cell wall biosynthesis